MLKHLPVNDISIPENENIKDKNIKPKIVSLLYILLKFEIFKLKLVNLLNDINFSEIPCIL